MTEEDGLVERASSLAIDPKREAPPSPPPPPAMGLEQAESLILRWESSTGEQTVWESSSEDASEYLQAVDLLHHLSLAAKTPGDRERARTNLNLAAVRLKNEFKHLLAVHTECVNPSWLPESFSAPSFGSVNNDVSVGAQEEDGEALSSAGETSAREVSCIIDLLPPAIVSDLSDIAARMAAMGRAGDCVEAYVLVRKGVLEDSLFLLGVENFGVEEIHRMTWEVLEPQAKRFIKGLKVAVKVMFASERFLCDEVFGENLDHADACFGEMANTSALQILASFRACATGPGSPERLFRLLDMYEALKELFPEIERSFQGEVGVEVRTESLEVLDLLGSAVKSTFMELKTAIENDATRTSVAGGALHPLTRYVMNYLGFLSEYLDTLKELYGHDEHHTTSSSPEAASEEFESEQRERSELEAKLMLVLEALMRNVEDNSRLYRDPALTSVFLMNNTHYIVQKAKASEMQSLIGNSWLRRHSSLVRFHAMNYQRLAWGRIFTYLRDEGIRGSGFTVSTEVLKDRFRSFNSAFEEIHRTQSGWIVPEVKLRDELRVLIADKLLPAYRSFLGRYRVNLEGLRHSERYLRYSAEDLEAHLNDLFEGAPGSMNRRRSFSTG